MEQLLSTSFDLLSSYDPLHIRKGLRCLEGFLAKMCLSPSAHSGRYGTAVSTRPNDAAFREFVRLQSGFEWNVTTRLISCLERLLGRTTNGQTNLLILSTLDLIQGLLLLHPNSRKLFAREIHMNVLLDLLDASNSSAVQSSALLTLVCALMDHPTNTRTFEALDGLATVSSLFRHRETPRDVKLRILEFLYFYLMPEVPTAGVQAAPIPGQLRVRSQSPVKNRTVRIDRSTEEKQRLLGEHMQNVEGLVADLRESQPFGI